MQKLILITVKNGVKYQLGIKKSVAEVINEIRSCKDDFYQVINNCAIRKDQIVSVEQFEYNSNEGEEKNR